MELEFRVQQLEKAVQALSISKESENFENEEKLMKQILANEGGIHPEVQLSESD